MTISNIKPLIHTIYQNRNITITKQNYQTYMQYKVLIGNQLILNTQLLACEIEQYEEYEDAEANLINDLLAEALLSKSA